MPTRLGWIACALGAAVVALAALVSGCRVAQTEAPATLCWRSLAPDAGPQDLGLAVTNPTLASAGPGEAWLGWEEDGPRIFRWVTGHWMPAALPLRVGVEGMSHPVVAAAPSGRVFVAVSANGDDGISALHIARATDGSREWLGAALISSKEPVTHANEASIAFLDGDRPVVAWSEERDVQLAGLLSPGGTDRRGRASALSLRLDPEEYSMVIIEKVWTLLQAPSIPSTKPEEPRR